MLVSRSSSSSVMRTAERHIWEGNDVWQWTYCNWELVRGVGGATAYEAITMIIMLTHAKHEIWDEPNGLIQKCTKPVAAVFNLKKMENMSYLNKFTTKILIWCFGGFVIIETVYCSNVKNIQRTCISIHVLRSYDSTSVIELHSDISYVTNDDHDDHHMSWWSWPFFLLHGGKV